MPSRTLPPGETASERHSIDELSALAGVTPRTVRYYIAQGLLDHPEGAKRGAYYERRHVEQLLLIRRWTDAGLSLDRVRELLAGAPEDPPRRPAPPGSVEVWLRRTPVAFVADRRKQGFAVPMAKWLRGDLRGWARERLMATLGSRIGRDIRDRFHFNTAIAAIMELVNHMYQLLESPPREERFWPVMREATEAMILLISPIVPHIAEELWQTLGHNAAVADAPWPKYNDAIASEDELTVVIQINGKLRSRITVPAGEDPEKIKAFALADEKIKAMLKDAAVKKVIYVPNKLVNIVAQ